MVQAGDGRGESRSVEPEPDDSPPHRGRAERTLPSILVLAAPAFKK